MIVATRSPTTAGTYSPRAPLKSRPSLTMSLKTMRKPITTPTAPATAPAAALRPMDPLSQPARYSGASPASRPATPLARLQLYEVNAPQPEIWSPIMLPTRPVKNPATGPNAKPKNGTSANAGRTSTAVVPGTGTLNRPTSTPYSAAPIAEYTMVRESTDHSEFRSVAPRTRAFARINEVTRRLQLVQRSSSSITSDGEPSATISPPRNSRIRF